MPKSTFGIIGLGVMGRSLALNVASEGFTVSVFNRKAEGEETLVEDFMASHWFENIQGFSDLKAFTRSLEQPRAILIMIKAGKPVDLVGYDLQPHLSDGDILIDGGNSFYEDTRRRHKEWSLHGVHFMGCGISGGEEGALKGPSMMVGGSQSAYRSIEPIVRQIAAKDENEQPCVARVGPVGAGHFVKMIHNGIEYAEMQLLAEMYALLGPHLSYEEIAIAFKSWNETELNGYLLEITSEILTKKVNDTYALNIILDSAGSKGTGAWSSIEAHKLGSPATLMTAAVHNRYLSVLKEVRSRLSEQAKSPSQEKGQPDISALKNAYQFARIINHLQGFQLIQLASSKNDWNISLADLARIWTNGCIIKSSLMKRLHSLFTSSEDIWENNPLIDDLRELEDPTSDILHHGLNSNTALPCISASYNFWLGLNTLKSPANLIQAQRDFFGAHGFERTDGISGELHHINWKE